MQGNGTKAEVPEHQRQPLCVVAGGGKNDEGIATQLIENVNQVHILRKKSKKCPHTACVFHAINIENFC